MVTTKVSAAISATGTTRRSTTRPSARQGPSGSRNRAAASSGSASMTALNFDPTASPASDAGQRPRPAPALLRVPRGQRHRGDDEEGQQRVHRDEVAELDRQDGEGVEARGQKRDGTCPEHETRLSAENPGLSGTTANDPPRPHAQPHRLHEQQRAQVGERRDGAADEREVVVLGQVPPDRVERLHPGGEGQGGVAEPLADRRGQVRDADEQVEREVPVREVARLARQIAARRAASGAG